MSTLIHVAVGVMYNANGQVMIAKRPEGVHQGGKLEFPGGKVEPNETVQMALVREFEEELGVCIDSQTLKPLICLTHHYAEKSVKLDVWEIHKFNGEPVGKEGQLIEWMNIQDLQPSAFPDANVAIITALRLPKTLMVTPNLNLHDANIVLPDLIRQADTSHCVVRLPQLNVEEYRTVWMSLKQANPNKTLIIHQHVSLALELNEPLHVRADQLRALDESGIKKIACFSASVHGIEEQIQAQKLGACFTVFGSVKTTPTHEGKDGLGWEVLSDVSSQANIPVYAIGGMSRDDIPTAIDNGAQGVAGIRLFDCDQ